MKGKVISWRESNAYGFILPLNGEEAVFLHRSALQNKRRVPQANDVITYTLTHDSRNRPRAEQATFSGEKRKAIKPPKRMIFPVIFSTSFILFLLWSVVESLLPLKVVAIYMGMSVLTFVVYGFDKYKAQKELWRIPEVNLQVLALFAGWPGALYAQKLLRHKSKKTAFILGLWLCITINITGLLWFYFPHLLPINI